jgi:hypothetical protein
MQAHFIVYRLDAPSIAPDVAGVLEVLQDTALEVHAGPMGTGSRESWRK